MGYYEELGSVVRRRVSRRRAVGEHVAGVLLAVAVGAVLILAAVGVSTLL